MKKAPSDLWKHFTPNLKVFYLYVAAFVGLVLTVFNGVTLTKTYLESEVFGLEYSYVDYWTCENKATSEGASVAMTDAEMSECMERVMTRAKETYVTEAKRAYASGVAGLLFGVILWIPHFVLARRA